MAPLNELPTNHNPRFERRDARLYLFEAAVVTYRFVA
jgi:hypothetical protein